MNKLTRADPFDDLFRGFFMRPVGGILLGIYADRKGRKAAMQLARSCCKVCKTCGKCKVGFMAGSVGLQAA